MGKGKKDWLEEFSASENDIKRNLTDEETQKIVKRLRWIAQEHRIRIGSF